MTDDPLGERSAAPRYRAPDLLAYASLLLERAGLAPERALIVAEMLLEGDLLGHSTHGLDLLAPYLKELDAGAMARDGDPETLSDLGSTVTWNGRQSARSLAGSPSHRPGARAG